MMLYDSIVFTRAAVCEIAVQVKGREHAPVGDDAGNEVRAQ